MRNARLFTTALCALIAACTAPQRDQHQTASCDAKGDNALPKHDPVFNGKIHDGSRPPSHPCRWPSCPSFRSNAWYALRARFDLITDPKEEYPQAANRNSWIAGPVVKVIVDFEKSLKQHPPIAPGTRDPYMP